IVNRMAFTFRASAFFLSSQLYFNAGNYETALARCDDMITIFEQDSAISARPVSWYYTNRLFPHCVVAPQPATAAFLVALIAWRQGSQEAVKRYLNLFMRFCAQQVIPGKEAITDDEALPHELSKLMCADTFLAIDPKQTIEILQGSLSLLEDSGAPMIVVYR